MLSFVVAGITCVFAALCYAEFASMVPVAGSRLHLRLRHAGRAVRLDHRLGPGARIRRRRGHRRATAGRDYFQSVLAKLRHPACPRSLSDAAVRLRPGTTGQFVATGVVVNLPAVLIVAARHRRPGQGHQGERHASTPSMVVIKLAAVLFVIVVGAFYVNPANWHPFAPYGWPALSFFGNHVCRADGRRAASRSGMLAGAAIIFFAYIGFDSVSTHAEEAKNPQRDVPIGIIASLRHLHRPLHRRRRRADRHGPLRPDRHRRRRLRRLQAGGPAAGPSSSSPPAGVAGITSVLLVMMLSAAARLPGDGPRRPGAAEASSPTSTRRSARPGSRTILIGVFVAVHGRLPAASTPCCRPDQHRHAVRLRHRLRRGAHHAAGRTRTPSGRSAARACRSCRSSASSPACC